MGIPKTESVTLSTDDMNLLVVGSVLTATQQRTIQLFDVLKIVLQFWSLLTVDSRITILKELEHFCKMHEDTHNVRAIVQELKKTCIFFQR